MKKYFVILSLLPFCPWLKSHAQVSVGGNPVSSYYGIQSAPPEVILPALNVDSLLQADDSISSPGHSYKYGHPVDINCGLNNSGKWDTLPDGGRLWRLKIKTPNAKAINLIYNSYQLPEGALFYLYNPDQSVILGGFSFMNNKSYSKFSTGIVAGETTIIELYEPAAVTGQTELNISRAVGAFKNIELIGSPGNSGACNIDVECPEGNDWCIEKRAVTLITDNDGVLCTGAMINNVNQDLTPYFLTANHCVEGSPDVNTWLFWFRNWDFNCDNNVDAANPVFGISGATLRANNAETDFALLELSGQPRSGIGGYYAGWDNIANNPQNGTGIHHPLGDLMKISIDNDPIITNPNTINWVGGTTSAPNTHWNAIFDAGVTERGSSGSPLFNQNHSIVGQLHGGSSSCDNQNGNSFYGRFDISWNNSNNPAEQLAAWLDPNATGINQIGATGVPIHVINRTIAGNQNFTAINTLQLEGNIDVTANAPFPVSLTCATSQQPLATLASANVEFKSRDGRVILKPGVRLLGGSSVRIRTDEAVNCATDNLIAGDFVAGPCQTNASPIAGKKGFNQTDKDKEIQENEQKFHASISVFPNPTSGHFTLLLPAYENSPHTPEIVVTDMMGRIIYQKKTKDPQLQLDISSQAKGVYFVKVQTGEQILVEKLVLQ